MSSRRFVFVPLFGDATIGNNQAAWLNAPHIKAWGFVENGDFTPVYTDPSPESIELHKPYTLFDAEVKFMADVPENSTDLPDEVCQALAVLALHPEALVREG